MYRPINKMLHLPSKIVSSYPWVKAPFIIGAPMRVMSGPSLAVAVSRAGGLGFIGPSVKTKDIAKDLEEASTLVKTIRESSDIFTKVPHNILPVGVGFQLWSDELDAAVSAIQRHRPCAAWLFAPRNGQRDLNEWATRIRGVSAQTQIWVQIGTVAEAKELNHQDAVTPDVVVVQGAEAGGHGRSDDGLGLITLFPEVADVLAGKSEILLCAAGGIADGRGAAAALALGAHGVAMGTRFLAATEARLSKGYQNEVVRASDGAVSTTRTLLYNQLRGTVGWPGGYSPRTIINKSHVEFQNGKTFDELKVLHDEALKAGDAGWGPEGRLATYAGAAVGLIHEVKGAGDIVEDTRQQILQRFSTLQSH
ncbi:putative oxidoreductase 2-nitropropane dioxygenase family [Aspergillus karnatakaensis]|uniref:nitronate monooxygenase n=1 Tax=Aspergillus karnatakaensis TaxID=1810916 RepID=UPI003CCD6618